MIAISVFLYFSRRIYWKYDDQWIIGKREWEIVERYGEFDYETKPGVRMGYYIGEENNVFETHGKKLYYFILFDNDYKAKKVVIGGRPGKDWVIVKVILEEFLAYYFRKFIEHLEA